MVTKVQAVVFRDQIIRKALKAVQLGGENAEELLLGTAIQESELTFRRQRQHGPGRGLFQMEPATHNDIWQNYLTYHHHLARQLAALLRAPRADKIHELEYNDSYACAMARIHYQRRAPNLPRTGDVAAMAACWKRNYNTVFGAGTPAQYEANWHKVMG